MSTETPAEEAATGAAQLSDLLAGHQATPDHDTHREVGDPKEPDAAPQPSPQPAPVAETKPATPPAEPDPATDPKAPKWYRDHLSKVNRELAQYRARDAERNTAPPPAPARPAQQAQLPNPAEDPQGYHEAMSRQYQSDMRQFRLEQSLMLSERFARQQYGNEAFEDCKAWLTTRPDLEVTFLTQPDQWGSAFAYYNREKLAEEIGDDTPTAYRKRIEEEAIARYRAGQEAHYQPAPAPTMRAAPPQPASTARSAAPGRDDQGRFVGPRPLGAALKNRF